jgi:hypothetical protein
MNDKDAARLESKVDEILVILRGPPENPDSGLIVQIALLKADNRRAKWWTRSIVLAWIAALIGAAASKFGFIPQQ